MLPRVVDVVLRDRRARRVVRDRVQVQQVAEVDRHEERDFGAQPFVGEVRERRRRGLAGLVEVGAVAGRLVEQRARADHRALVVAPQLRFHHAPVADVVRVQVRRLLQAAAHPFVRFLRELQVRGVVRIRRTAAPPAPPPAPSSPCCVRRCRSRSRTGCRPRTPAPGRSCQPAISNAMIPSALPSSERLVRQLVQPHQLDPHPVVVVVVLRPARSRRRRDRAVERRQRARVRPFRGARVVRVQVEFRPTRRACSSCASEHRPGAGCSPC